MELVGLEALSRGAKKTILCDKSKQAINIIKKNIEKTHMENRINLYQLDFKELLETKVKEKIDIVFIDPPYNSNFAIQAVEIIIKKNLICEDSLIIIETDQEEKVVKQLQQLQVEITDKRKYGRIHLIFLSQKGKG